LDNFHVERPREVLKIFNPTIFTTNFLESSLGVVFIMVRVV
jgi:hypothetical protein